MSNIVLIGFMGSGKTTIGRELAKKLKMEVVDMDHEIEVQEGRKITEIFSSDGEAAFRSMETAYLRGVRGIEGKILSTGGGIVETEENFPLMHEIGTVVFLQASVEHIMNNVAGDTSRPLLLDVDVKEKVTSMLEYREPLYLSAADVIVQTSGKSVKAIVDELLKIL